MQLDILELLLLWIAIINLSCIVFKDMVRITLFKVLIWLILFIEKKNFIDLLFVLIFSMIELSICFVRWKIFINNFREIETLNYEKNRKDDLLCKLLPKHIIANFYSRMCEKQSFQEELRDVTLLYADIAGFTLWAASVTPEKVVGMLRTLYNKFD